MKKYINPIGFFAFILIIGLTTACNEEPKKANGTKTEIVNEPFQKRSVPRFDRDSAYAFVAKQVSFGPRVPNTEAHRKCKEWLSGKLKEFGAEVIEQDFQAEAYTGEMLNGTNIIGQFNPHRKKRVLLGAHWDSRHIADKDDERVDEPIDGADDGASGVGALLEIARQLGKNGIDIGVDIIFFDAEDLGKDNRDPNDKTDYTNTWCLGSQHWGKNLHRPGYTAQYGILLDMVGAKNARFAQEELSMKINPTLVNKIWTMAGQMNQGKYFVNALGPGVTDDHYFVTTLAKIPMIDIINLPEGNKTFGHYHHTHDDNIDLIDPNTLNAAGQVVLAVLYNENNQTF